MTDDQTAMPPWTTCNHCMGLISGVDPYNPTRRFCTCDHNQMIPLDKFKEELRKAFRAGHRYAVDIVFGQYAQDFDSWYKAVYK